MTARRPLHQPNLRKRALAQAIGPGVFVLQQGRPAVSAEPVWLPFTLPDAREGEPYSYNVGINALGADTTTLQSGTLPTGITYSHPLLSGTPTETGTFAGLVFRATNAEGSTDSDAKSLTVVVVPLPTWDAFTLPNAEEGQPYSYDVGQHANDADTTVLQSGTLPAGITYTHPLLSGTPTESGTFANLVFRATGAGGSADSPAKTLTVDPPPPPAPTWDAFTLPNAEQGVAYSYNVGQHANNATTTALFSGTLPAGITYTHPNLSGTPTENGTFANLVFRATGAGGTADSPAKTLTVDPPSFVTTNVLGIERDPRAPTTDYIGYSTFAPAHGSLTPNTINWESADHVLSLVRTSDQVIGGSYYADIWTPGRLANTTRMLWQVEGLADIVQLPWFAGTTRYRLIEPMADDGPCGRLHNFLEARVGQSVNINLTPSLTLLLGQQATLTVGGPGGPGGAWWGYGAGLAGGSLVPDSFDWESSPYTMTECRVFDNVTTAVQIWFGGNPVGTATLVRVWCDTLIEAVDCPWDNTDHFNSGNTTQAQALRDAWVGNNGLVQNISFEFFNLTAQSYGMQVDNLADGYGRGVLLPDDIVRYATNEYEIETWRIRDDGIVEVQYVGNVKLPGIDTLFVQWDGVGTFQTQWDPVAEAYLSGVPDLGARDALGALVGQSVNCQLSATGS